jgi:hypothetical protein
VCFVADAFWCVAAFSLSSSLRFVLVLAIAFGGIFFGIQPVPLSDTKRSTESPKGRSLGFDNAEKLPETSNKSGDRW